MLNLSLAKLEGKQDFFEGKRIVLDFMENFGKEDCIFVGNTSSGFVPLVSENHESDNYRARTFRFNAGALHQYVLISQTEVRYLDELTPGDKVLVKAGNEFKQIPVARIKKEIRGFSKLNFSLDGENIGVIVQSNATVCVLTDKGIKSVDALEAGDTAYVLKWGKASHLGKSKEEYCEEI